MPKVRSELRHQEEAEVPEVPALEAQLRQELVQLSEAEAVEVSIAPAAIDMEAAKAKIRAMFQQDAPPPPAPPEPEPAAATVEAPLAMPDGTATERLRRETLSDLIAQGWKHTEAVAVANRVKELLDEDDETGLIYALETATEEHVERANLARQAERSRVPTKRLPEPVEDDEPEPGSEIPASAGTGRTGYGEPNDELFQILHNLQRDIARLARLFDMEGVKKTRKKANG